MVFLPILSLSQTTDLSVPEKIKNRMNNIEILGYSHSNYYVVRYNKSLNQEFVFSRYNKDLQLAGMLEFQIDKANNVEEILLVDDKIHIYYSAYSRETKTYNLYCTILTDRFSFESRDNPVASTKVTTISKIFRITYDRLYKQILVMFPVSTEDDIVKFGFVQLSPALKVLNSYQEVLSPEKDFSIEQLTLSGNLVAMIIRHSTGSGFLKAGKEKLFFIKIDMKNESFSSFPLFNDSLTFSTLVYRYDFLKQRYVIGGFYYTREKENDKGLGVVMIPVPGNPVSVNYIPFSSEMIQTLEGAGGNKKGLSDFYAKRMVLTDNGGMVLLAEKFTVVKEVMNNYYSLNNVYIRYFFRFSDVLVASVSPYGNIEWTKVVRKEQTTLNDDGFYSSFHATSFRDKIVMIFNDISRSNWNLIYNTIDPDGNVDYQILYTSSKLAGTAIPRNARQVNVNEILVPVINVSKGFFLLRIKF